MELAFSSCVHGRYGSFHHHVQRMQRDDMDAGRNLQCVDATKQFELLGFVLEIWSKMEQMFECWTSYFQQTKIRRQGPLIQNLAGVGVESSVVCVKVIVFVFVGRFLDIFLKMTWKLVTLNGSCN